MIIPKPYLCTVLPIWSPKYSTDSGDWEVWVSQRKVNYASPVILIQFTRAKHLTGQRFCVTRKVVERSPLGSNGRIPVYKVPFDKLDSWTSASEVLQTIERIFP